MTGFILVFMFLGLCMAYNHPDNPLLQILSSLRFKDMFSNFLTFSTTFDSPSFPPSSYSNAGVPPRFWSLSSLSLSLPCPPVPGEFIHSHLSKSVHNSISLLFTSMCMSCLHPTCSIFKILLSVLFQLAAFQVPQFSCWHPIVPVGLPSFLLPVLQCLFPGSNHLSAFQTPFSSARPGSQQPRPSS